VRRVTAEGALHLPVARVEAKLRYRSSPVAATVAALEGGFALDLDEPAEAVAPGQVAVLYHDDAVVGAGVIREADPV
jgi:tRNA-specific 2-thiouridylase